MSKSMSLLMMSLSLFTHLSSLFSLLSLFISVSLLSSLSSLLLFSFTFSSLLVTLIFHVKSISPIQQNSMKNGYDENNNYNKSDETKCATKPSDSYFKHAFATCPPILELWSFFLDLQALHLVEFFQFYSQL